MRKKINKDNMRRLISVLMLVALAAMLCVPSVSAADIANGSCGTGLSWRISMDGKLIIAGNGEMAQYSENNPAPWYEFRDQIRVITVENGVTSIGKYAFYGLSSAVSASLADSVKTIGNHAFFECIALKMISLGGGIETIRDNAFESCEALRTLKLPNTLKTIGTKAFYRCYSLQTITVPASVTSLGDMIFSYCTSLVYADIRASVSSLPYWMFYACESLSSLALAPNFTEIEKKAFYQCDQLTTVRYPGTEENAEKLLEDIRNTSIADFPDYGLSLYTRPVNGGTSSSTQTTEDHIITNQTTVTVTGNATVSTTVTESTEYTKQGESMIAGKTHTSVSIDATLENQEGWKDLLDAVTQGDILNVENKQMQVEVNLQDEKEISASTLNAFAGKDLNLTIGMKDGSAIQIDCNRLTETKDPDETITSLSYVLTPNENPTKAHIKMIGDAESFLLSFDGSANFDYSPQIYFGKDYSYQVATLYQYVPGRGLSLLQSVVVDKTGFATYYLSSTKASTQYLIAFNVKDVDLSSAILPHDIAADYPDVFLYEQIEYVETGVRLFMGLSLFQFSVAVFCVMLFLFVAVGAVMTLLYRKKKLERYYRELKEKNA